MTTLRDPRIAGPGCVTVFEARAMLCYRSQSPMFPSGCISAPAFSKNDHIVQNRRMPVGGQSVISPLAYVHHACVHAGSRLLGTASLEPVVLQRLFPTNDIVPPRMNCPGLGRRRGGDTTSESSPSFCPVQSNRCGKDQSTPDYSIPDPYFRSRHPHPHSVPFMYFALSPAPLNIHLSSFSWTLCSLLFLPFSFAFMPSQDSLSRSES